jgi:hypothetical protein
VSRNALGLAATIIIVGWVAIAYFLGDRRADTIGSIAAGALLLVALVMELRRVAKERDGGR